MSREQDAENTPQCEEIFCDTDAVVTVVNIRNGSEHKYCLEHAEEALESIPSLNVGQALATDGGKNTCNIPGCDEPLGDYGVWCEEHYQQIKEDEND